MAVEQYIDSAGNVIHRTPAAQASIEDDSIPKQMAELRCRYITPTTLGPCYQSRAELEKYFEEEDRHRELRRRAHARPSGL